MKYGISTNSFGMPVVYETDDEGSIGPWVVTLSIHHRKYSKLAEEFAEFLAWRQWRTDPPPEDALILVQYRVRDGTRIAPGSSRNGRIHVDVGAVGDDLIGWRPLIPEEQWPSPLTPKEGLPAIDRLLQEDSV